MGLTMRELCPETDHYSSRWFALGVRHQCERRVEGALCAHDVETYVPTFRAKRPWSDRVKERDEPLFPGYVFGRFSYRQQLRVLQTPGVAWIVGFGGVPAPLEDAEIGNLRLALESKLNFHPWPHLHTGDRVRIERGPLRGVEGILLREKPSFRLVLGVEMLRRCIAVEVDPELVTRC